MGPIGPVLVLGGAVTAAALACLRLGHGLPAGGLRRAVAALGTGGLALGLAVAAAAWGWAIAVPVWIGLAGTGGFAVALGAAWPRASATDRSRPARRPPRRGEPPGPGASRPLARGRLAGAVALGGLAATALALALAAWLPMAAADRAVLAVVLWPALWCGWICQLYAGPSAPRAFGAAAALSVAATAAAAVAARLAG